MSRLKLFARAMRAGRISLVVSTSANALYVLLLQVLALSTLQPGAFGVYSIQYLAYAFATSVCLSVLSESWLRTDLTKSYQSPWRDYSGVLIYIAACAGVLTLVGSLALQSLREVAVPGALAVASGTYRSGARYFAVRNRLERYVLIPDGLGLIVTVLVWLAFVYQHDRSLKAMVIIWACGATTAALASRPPVLRRVSVLQSWVRTHGSQIGPLLRDSLLLDLGAIGTPYVLAPILGLSDFGTYRAVSNASAPVRLVLTPLRPILSATPIISHRSIGRLLVNFMAALLFGIGTFVFLVLIQRLGLALGTLSELIPFAIPTALYVTFNFMGHYYYIVARGHASGSSLLVGRVVQTSLVTILPLGAALFGDIGVVIWSFTVATALWSTFWIVHVLRRAMRVSAGLRRSQPLALEASGPIQESSSFDLEDQS